MLHIFSLIYTTFAARHGKYQLEHPYYPFVCKFIIINDEYIHIHIQVQTPDMDTDVTYMDIDIYGYASTLNWYF